MCVFQFLVIYQPTKFPEHTSFLVLKTLSNKRRESKTGSEPIHIHSSGCLPFVKMLILVELIAIGRYSRYPNSDHPTTGLSNA